MNSLNIYNITTPTPAPGVSIYWGFIAVIISGICYGVNYLPVKKYHTGDGMFFQWILSNAIFIGGCIVNYYFHYPKFEPLVMLGGFLWASGNICVVPIITEIGLGMGLCLWGCMSIIISWASGRFGWFGIDPQIPKNTTLNYIGFAFIVVSPFIYSLIRTEVLPHTNNRDSEFENIINYPEEEFSIQISWFKRRYYKFRKEIVQGKSRIIGVSLSLIAGTLYGFMFIPVTYVKNRYHGSSKSDTDYLFAQTSGIYLGSTLYFIIYCFYKRNEPVLFPKVILPGLLSGAIWFVAYLACFVANEALSPAISQPISAVLPGLISLVLGVVVYKEIRGMRNYLLLIPAFIVSCTGITLIGLSKVM